MEFQPIGVARTPFHEKADAPRQPRAGEGIEGVLVLDPGRGFEDALRDLDGWSHLWVLFVFDRAEGWSPTVRPPRSESKRGVFATRAPRRPNPIGMSVVRLVAVEGLEVHVRDLDLLDGTPLLDIKPYVAWADAIGDASHGWLERPDDPGRFEVEFSERAHAQLVWLAIEGVDLRPRIRDQLGLGPAPHAYRRIKPNGDGFVLSVKRWRVSFRVEGRVVSVREVRASHRPRELADPSLEIPRRFLAKWPSER